MKNDKRQVIIDPGITKNKEYSDVLYGYLQNYSIYDPYIKERVISKFELNYTTIAAELGITRQTISKKFKWLLNNNLIKKDNTYYILIKIDKRDAALIDSNSIDKIVDKKEERLLSLYGNLIRWKEQTQNNRISVSLTYIKDILGYSVIDRNLTNKRVLHLFDLLRELGCIKDYSRVNMRYWVNMK